MKCDALALGLQLLSIALTSSLVTGEASHRLHLRTPVATSRSRSQLHISSSIAADGSSPKAAPDTLSEEMVDQATRQARNKEFDAVDRDHDGNISMKEYILSSTAPFRLAAYRFNCTDLNLDRSLDVHEFENVQANPDELERCVSMMMAFRMVDKDRNGEMTLHELWGNVAGPDVDARWAFMIACSDVNGDSRISPMEFTRDIYGCMQDRQTDAYHRYSNYSHWDADANGCLDQKEFSGAVNVLMGQDLLSKGESPSKGIEYASGHWMACGDADHDGCFTSQEFSAAEQGGQDSCIATGIQEYEFALDFMIMDANKNGEVSKQEFYTWCSELDLEVSHEEADALFHNADVDGDGFISEHEFLHAGSEHEGDGPGYLFFDALPLLPPQLAHGRGAAKASHANSRH